MKNINTRVLQLSPYPCVAARDISFRRNSPPPFAKGGRGDLFLATKTNSVPPNCRHRGTTLQDVWPMCKTRINTLLFDFGGTLDSDGIHWRIRAYRWIQVERQIEWDVFKVADDAAVQALIDCGWAHQMSLRETADFLAAEMFVRLNLSDEARGRYIEDFCASVTRYIQRNRMLLENLKRHYRLGVISNNFGNTQGWCDDYNLSPLMAVIVDSAVAGVSKPDARIFQIALNEMGVAPENAAYIGDSFSRDVVGAKNAGMYSIWLVGNEEKECPDESLVDVKIPSLTELTSL